MKNMLYFSDGTAGANATTEALCVSSDMIKSMEPISASLMHIYFHELREEQGATAAVGTDRFTYVVLTIGDGDFPAVAEDIVGALNSSRKNNNGFIVVADALNGKFLNGKITDAKIMFSDDDIDSTN